jgi:hypothetical protein
MSEPRDIPCPYCHARKGQECTNTATGVKVFTHPARIKAARPNAASSWQSSPKPWKAVLIVSAKGNQIKIHDAEKNVIATMNGPAAEANASALVTAINRGTE